MRTHHLRDLKIAGRDTALATVPDFNFHKLSKVVSLDIEFADGKHSNTSTMQMSIIYDDGNQRFVVKLLFSGIVRLCLGDMLPNLWLSELEVEDVQDSMMEGICFEIVAHTNYSFLCSCGELAIVGLDKC